MVNLSCEVISSLLAKTSSKLTPINHRLEELHGNWRCRNIFAISAKIDKSNVTIATRIRRSNTGIAKVDSVTGVSNAVVDSSNHASGGATLKM